MAKPVCLMLALLQVITYIPSKDAQYIGGTINTIPKDALGKLSVDDDKVLSFKWGKSRKSEAGEWRVPYDKVTSLSYGQHAGRRVAASIGAGLATAPLFGIGALPVLFSKKRRHYLTIEWLDDQGKRQAAIFNVGKKAIRVTLKTLEVRTGKKVEYDDEDARKAGNK